MSSAASGGYSLISLGLGLVTGALGSLFGGSAAPAPPPAPAAASGPSPASASINVRTLGDQRKESKKDDQQFYNGNAVSNALSFAIFLELFQAMRY